MLPQQCIPSPVGEGASLKLLSGLHSLAATVRQDVQMSSYIHPNRKEAGDQHSSDQLMTRRSSRKLQKIGSHTNSYRNCYHKIKFMYRYFTLSFHPLSMSVSFYHSVCTACHIFVQVTLILATVATLIWYLKWPQILLLVHVTYLGRSTGYPSDFFASYCRYESRLCPSHARGVAKLSLFIPTPAVQLSILCDCQTVKWTDSKVNYLLTAEGFNQLWIAHMILPNMTKTTTISFTPKIQSNVHVEYCSGSVEKPDYFTFFVHLWLKISRPTLKHMITYMYMYMSDFHKNWGIQCTTWAIKSNKKCSQKNEMHLHCSKK